MNAETARSIIDQLATSQSVMLATNDIMLYSTDVAVTDGMTLSLTAKNDDGKARLVAYYGDDSTAS